MRGRKWRRPEAAGTGAGAGHGGLRGGERAAARTGGAGARDRRLPAERRHGDPGAVEGEGRRAAAGAPGRPVQRRRPEGRVRALGPDPLPHPGGHRATPRGLQLLGPKGLSDGAEPGGLRPAEAGGAGARLRAAAGALTARGHRGDAATAPRGHRRPPRDTLPPCQNKGKPWWPSGAGAVDELRQPEHGAAAVQDLRLHPRPARVHAGDAGHDGGGGGAGPAGLGGGGGGDEVHPLRGGRPPAQGRHRGHRRRHLPPVRAGGADRLLLVRPPHRHQLL